MAVHIRFITSPGGTLQHLCGAFAAEAKCHRRYGGAKGAIAGRFEDQTNLKPYPNGFITVHGMSPQVLEDIFVYFLFSFWYLA